MPGRQAKIITPTMLRRTLSAVRSNDSWRRDHVIILLSVKAGLRACEIARLEWSMALDARGRIADYLSVHDVIAKKRSGRRIPIHPELRRALAVLRQSDRRDGPIVRSARGGAMQPNSIVNWFVAMFADLKFEGCSSHSGRRTFITAAARSAHKAGCSLRDVQLLAGHRSIEITQGYIDGDTLGQRRLVALIQPLSAQRPSMTTRQQEFAMKAVSRWIARHPSWFESTKVDIEDGHEGWRQIIDAALSSAEQILSIESGESFKIMQIKEKLGALTIYFRATDLPIVITDRLREIMHDARAQSLTVCEICGAPAQLGMSGACFSVRCMSCAPDDWAPASPEI